MLDVVVRSSAAVLVQWRDDRALTGTVTAASRMLFSGGFLIVEMDQTPYEEQRKNQNATGIGNQTGNKGRDGRDEQKADEQEQHVHFCYITRAS